MVDGVVVIVGGLRITLFVVEDCVGSKLIVMVGVMVAEIVSVAVRVKVGVVEEVDVEVEVDDG